MECLNGFDMAIAIPEHTINDQFSKLMKLHAIDNAINISYRVGETDLHMRGLLNPPTVKLSPPGESENIIYFNINFSEGMLEYAGVSRGNIDLTDWTLTLKVNLKKIQIAPGQFQDLSVRTLPSKLLSRFIDDSNFSVEAIFVDFDNVNDADSFLTARAGAEQDAALLKINVIAAVRRIINVLTEIGNPFIIGVHAASRDPAATLPQMPFFAPTSMDCVAFDDVFFFCLMLNNKPSPFPSGKIRRFELLPADLKTKPGCLLIENSSFNNGYIAQLILPRLKRAMGTDAQWTCEPSTGDWSLLEWIDNSNQHDGHGPVIHDGGTFGLDLYGRTLHAKHCTLKLDPAQSVGNKLVYIGDGYFQHDFSYSMKPMGAWSKVADANAKVSFDFSIELSAEDGEISVKFFNKPPRPASDTKTYSLGDLLNFFNSNVDKAITGLNDDHQQFLNAGYKNFSRLAQAIPSLSQQFILPAPEQLNYNSAGLTPNKTIAFDINI